MNNSIGQTVGSYYSTYKMKESHANRVSTILNHSEAKQWRYVSSSQNPADDTTHGKNIKKLIENKRWFDGPSFLY